MKWVCLALVVLVGAATARDAKWFLSQTTVTRYVTQKQQMKTPSSCVILEESLKPCRQLRLIDISPPSVLPRIMMTPTPRLDDPPAVVMRSSLEERRSWSWGDLGLRVTQTVTQTVTPRLATHAVVTFSVRGCQPSRLPFDLHLCPVATTNNSDADIKDVHFVEE